MATVALQPLVAVAGLSVVVVVELSVVVARLAVERLVAVAAVQPSVVVAEPLVEPHVAAAASVLVVDPHVAAVVAGHRLEMKATIAAHITMSTARHAQ